MCIFALARTTSWIDTHDNTGCELLQNVYFCISTYNNHEYHKLTWHVVNCFKMCIFALARTTPNGYRKMMVGCELLQNVYFCISTYNLRIRITNCTVVVNCFKMCIFALARTTGFNFRCSCNWLWIASKCVFLH